jgi:hypothetical protein
MKRGSSLKKILNEIPKLPLTAFIFYFFMFNLWKMSFIPSPTEIVSILEIVYLRFGYFGLFIATFLEGIVYLGLYFPGSFIIAFAVFLSDGKFVSLLMISIIVAFTLTLTAFVNYFLGRCVLMKNKFDEFERSKKGLFASMLHPNLLAFYFFNHGIEKRDIRKILWVPFIMIPYGLFFAYMLSIFSNYAKQKLESVGFIMTLILVWLIISFVLEYRNKKLRVAKR